MQTCENGCNGCDECTDYTPTPMRESVADALLIVESYGPWGPDLNDAHRRQIVLADEVKRMNGTAEALQAEWDRECGDTDKILRLLGLAPGNCRTDGGSLKLQMVLGALEHRDVMTRREARKAERERCATLCDALAKVMTPDRRSVAEDLARAIREDQP